MIPEGTRKLMKLAETLYLITGEPETKLLKDIERGHLQERFDELKHRKKVWDAIARGTMFYGSMMMVVIQVLTLILSLWLFGIVPPLSWTFGCLGIVMFAGIVSRPIHNKSWNCTLASHLYQRVLI